MKTIFEMQGEFLRAGEVKFPSNDSALLDMSETLIYEEHIEFIAEIHTDINKLKECCDLIYVAAQYLNVQVGPDKAVLLFRAVHANNMEKCVDGKLVKREDGKILKPEGFNKMGWMVDFEKILGGE